MSRQYEELETSSFRLQAVDGASKVSPLPRTCQGMKLPTLGPTHNSAPCPYPSTKKKAMEGWDSPAGRPVPILITGRQRQLLGADLPVARQDCAWFKVKRPRSGVGDDRQGYSVSQKLWALALQLLDMGRRTYSGGCQMNNSVRQQRTWYVMRHLHLIRRPSFPGR